MTRTYVCISLLIIGLCISLTDGTECYSCNDVSSRDCNTTTICPDEQVCYLETSNVGGQESFTLGCEEKELCDDVDVILVGRDIHRRQSNVTCHQCCKGDLCNNNLCYQHTSTECQDDLTFDCPRLSSVFKICDDVENAAVTCPKFCNLCPIDGGWSDWSDWSSCNVTCEDGIQSRARSCDNPVPENRGRNCDGEDVEYLPCSNNPCPVHGSWSVWTEWGTCSVSCEVGIQRRDRHCSSPYPDNNGDHCFGDSRDDRICMTSPCEDGGWSSWGTWDECSVSCGGGLKKRHRHCNNPTPSPFGRQCEGNNADTETCNSGTCRGDEIAFKAYYGYKNSSTADRMIFRNIYLNLNLGHGYNTATGIFTAPVSGLYSFSATIRNPSTSDFWFDIRKNGNYISRSYLPHDQQGVSSSITTVTELDTGDEVDVHVGYIGSISADYNNQFIGHLVHRFT